MNGIAKIYRTRNAELEMDALWASVFDLNRALEIDPEFLSETAHEHDKTVGSVAIKGRIGWQQAQRMAQQATANSGTRYLRMKGILTIAGEDQRFVFQGVHMLFDGRADRPWKSRERK